ncbi:hypothetical protein MHB40_14425 [Lysinibacillus sp. FSL K6-0057]|uniref:hypothetical protein n=1 Tax=Lysinibacillus sp. FSL K6-0057 TaxID=2921411 RepID=UPI00315AB01A
MTELKCDQQDTNEREISIPIHNIIDVNGLNDLKKHIKDRYYSDTILNFKFEELNFPNTYVLVSSLYEPYEYNGEDDIWLRDRVQLDIFSIDNFKRRLISEITDFK